MKSNNEYNNKQNMKMLFIVFGMLVIASMAGVQIYKNAQPTIVAVENTFADVNGDGVLDVIVSGKVIINEAQPNL